MTHAMLLAAVTRSVVITTQQSSNKLLSVPPSSLFVSASVSVNFMLIFSELVRITFRLSGLCIGVIQYIPLFSPYRIPHYALEPYVCLSVLLYVSMCEVHCYLL